jgi:hypothetical protein
MADTQTRYWFMARSRTDGLIPYLTSAISIEAAAASFGCLACQYDFKQLTYEDLNKIFVCGVPAACRRADFAKGDILMQVRGDGLVIRIAD